MPFDTTDTIKRRMLRNASRIWGYSDIQDINSFDPVLGLMIGAFAEELHNISVEIDKADARIVHRLLELIFNKNIFTHFPAHGVAIAKSLLPRIELNELYQFYYSKEVHDAEDKEGNVIKKNIYFSPACDCTLFDGKVRYLFADRYLYEIDGLFKEIIAETNSKRTNGNTKLLVGLELNNQIEILDGLSLFFSFKNIQKGDHFYNALHAAKWRINGKDVIFKQGLDSAQYNSYDSLRVLLEKNNDISFKTCKFINDFYSKKFMTIAGENHRREIFMCNEIPAILKECFVNQPLKSNNEDILWVEIDFLQPVLSDEISDLTISMNSFPVVNRQLNEFTHSVVKGANVIPLYTDDLFFDVRRVTDSKNLVYMPRTSIESSEVDSHTYYIRQGGVARFDSRDARQTIKDLINLIREESNAFSVNGTDLISYELKQLDQILTRLQNRLNVSNIGQDLNSYLIVDSNAAFDKIHVQFWSVVGEKANGIRPGSKLKISNGPEIDEQSLFLVMQTFGGRQKLSNEDKLNTLRRSLLSKNRIVTVEDIKAACFELVGKDLKGIKVKKGITLENIQGKGMCRTLDIYLYLKEENHLTKEEIWHVTETLKIKLQSESVNLLPYRIFVE